MAEVQIKEEWTSKEHKASYNLEKPKISILMPCYNVENFIGECLASILKQTFNDFEVVCVDDGSKDKTLGLLNSIAKTDSRIKVFSQENQGPSIAYNNCINNAKGEFITFIDSDDWIDSDYLEKLYNSLIKNNCDISLAGVIRKRKYHEKYRIHYAKEEVFETLEDKIKACNVPKCCYAPGKLYKAELIKNSYFKIGVYYEDVLWLPEIIKNAKRVVTVPDINYYYRVNNESIVKKQQSKQKQYDLYCAKKYIVRFFDENHLDLAEKEKNITKSIKYIFNIPILKTKEMNGELSTILFGFIKIPKFLTIFFNLLNIFLKTIFSINTIDGHRIIYIFGICIRINLHQTKNSPELREYGLNKQKREKKIIASLTSFPKRIEMAEKTIKTLLNQTLKPDKLILWLAKEEFPNKEKDLPANLIALREYGLTICWYHNIKSYKKLIPTLKDYPNDIIITFDDDIYYDNNIIELLYEAHVQNPNCICTNRSSRLKLYNKKLVFLPDFVCYWSRYYDSTLKNSIIGCGGILYPPHSLNPEVFNEEKFMSAIPTQDDLWFWAMAAKNNTPIRTVSSYDIDFLAVENTQQFGLSKINRKNKGGIHAQDGLTILTKEYPEIIKNFKNNGEYCA